MEFFSINGGETASRQAAESEFKNKTSEEMAWTFSTLCRNKAAISYKRFMNWGCRVETVQNISRPESALASPPFSRKIIKMAYARCHKTSKFAKPALLLAITALCLFEFLLHRQNGAFQGFEVALLQMQWILVICISVWCSCFLFLTYSVKDLPLIGLLFIAIAALFIASSRAMDAVTLLFGVTLGKGVRVLLSRSSRPESAPTEKPEIDQSGLTSAATFLIGLVLLLAFGSWWHLDMTNNFYHGPRWMGLWNNPNDYGLLMGAGLTLAIGLLATKEHKEHKEQNQNLKAESEKRKSNAVWNFLRSLRSFAANKVFIVLLIAAGMMGVGLAFSYSRGACVGTAVGLLYLAKAYGKFKWRYVLPPILLAVAMVCFFWNTPRTAPWYFQRLDLSRGSVQHRVAAWKAGFEIMRDHPLGVGWNKTVETYEKNYSPPEDGAAAIGTNDYLMLGTQLGIPGLLCFLAYVALCFRGRARHSVRAAVGPGRAALLRGFGRGAPRPYPGGQGTASPTLDSGLRTLDSQLRAACRAGALVMLVAFWFDGGLFKLATGTVFWILLELGTNISNEGGQMKQAQNVEKSKVENRQSDESLATKEHIEHREQNLKAESGKAETEISSPCPSPHPARRGKSLLWSLRSLVAKKSEIEKRKSQIGRSLLTSAATK